MSNVTNQEIARIRQGLSDLGNAIDAIVNKEPEPVEIPKRSISGDAIQGGKISQFQSVGIKDESTRLVVLVNNDGITTDVIDVETLEGDTRVTGNLNVEGEVHARRLHVDEVTSDTRLERSTPLEFKAEEGNSLVGKGLLFTGDGNTKQFVLHSNPDKFYSSIGIDLHRETSYSINGLTVLSEDTLGTSVSTSSLRKVGTLIDLKTQGDLNIDEYVFWNSVQERFAIGTDQPNGMLTVTKDNTEVIIDPEGGVAKLGTFTTSDLNIVTDDTTRIYLSQTGKIVIGSSTGSNVKIQGKLGVNVTNPECDFESAGPIRFQEKKFEVGEKAPSNGFYRQGDIVWNSNPQPTSYVAWICIREGTPGVWKPFGQIST